MYRREDVIQLLEQQRLARDMNRHHTTISSTEP